MAFDVLYILCWRLLLNYLKALFKDSSNENIIILILKLVWKLKLIFISISASPRSTKLPITLEFKRRIKLLIGFYGRKRFKSTENKGTPADPRIWFYPHFVTMYVCLDEWRRKAWTLFTVTCTIGVDSKHEIFIFLFLTAGWKEFLIHI